ncbi:MAG TPA: POTRA domain-containing protein [Vicinamibacterales bacterium]|nr:POTRA domain-containing protein [Vicinamibacterales bacterium]
MIERRYLNAAVTCVEELIRGRRLHRVVIAVLVVAAASAASAQQPSTASVPVVFDNFVWFGDEEIGAALRKTIPAFDGTVSTAPGAPEALARDLQALLRARRIPGVVEALPQGTLKAGVERYIFRVKDPSPQVCAVRIEGATAIAEADLLARAPLAGTDYSRSSLRSVLQGLLIDSYRQRGHWRAAFGAPVTVLDEQRGCVTVTAPVKEGPAYTWDHAEWIGNAAIPSRELDAVLAIKTGELAALARLEEGLRRAQRAYGQRGYVLERATYTPRLDDLTRRAVFEIRVDEGPQFKMGTVEFPGLAPADAAGLLKRWQLKPGDVFDASYPDRFMDEEIVPRIPRGARMPAIESRADQQNRTIHVRYVFGG